MIYNFTDLILLVGTNPLPNYVTAKYFLNNNLELKQIWLIFSERNNNQEGTKELAESIKNILLSEYQSNGLTFQLTGLSDIGSSNTICSDLANKMKISADTVLHFNYTGGTKAMAVHAYCFLKEKYGRISFSYLDGREYVLKEDNHGIISDDLRDEIGISLEKLIDLHGYKKYNSKPHKIQGDKNNLDDELRGTEEKLLNPDETIKGDILEDYVYTVIDIGLKNDPFLSKKYQSGLITMEKNWTIIKKTGNGKGFELDVIIINGYQICPISCTTSKNIDKCKTKSFEVWHRAKQIGGEEAKKIFVSRYDKNLIEDFKADLETISGFSESNFKVLSRSDLKRNDLWTIIKNFIWGS